MYNQEVEKHSLTMEKLVEVASRLAERSESYRKVSEENEELNQLALEQTERISQQEVSEKQLVETLHWFHDALKNEKEKCRMQVEENKTLQTQIDTLKDENKQLCGDRKRLWQQLLKKDENKHLNEQKKRAREEYLPLDEKKKMPFI